MSERNRTTRGSTGSRGGAAAATEVKAPRGTVTKSEVGSAVPKGGTGAPSGIPVPARIPRIWIGLAALLITAGGCSKKEGGEAGGGGFAMPPTPVETATVSEGAVADRFEAVGSIEARESITVVSEISAAVVSLPFREGQSIRQGGLIAQLDDSELRAALERAEALRDQQQTSYDRIKHVVEQNAGTPQDLDDAAARLKVAEADVALAQARFEKTRIVAPFDGVTGARQVSPGAFLQPGDPITDLAQIHEIKVVFTAPERYVPKLQPGEEVQISTTAYPGVSLTGVIDVVDPVLDPETRSVQVIARAQNPEGRFRPGMSADVSAVLSERTEALSVPNEAVFAEGDQSYVYVVNPDSTVARTPVSLGIRLASSVEVLDGLQPGMRVVRAGHQKLYPGARVMPVSSREAGPGGAEPGAPGAAPGAAPSESGAAGGSSGATESGSGAAGGGE